MERNLTHADISARAYEIWENRQTTDTPGTAEADWFEAERQLSNESRERVMTVGSARDDQ